jgi:hypothetical protein
LVRIESKHQWIEKVRSREEEMEVERSTRDGGKLFKARTSQSCPLPPVSEESIQELAGE